MSQMLKVIKDTDFSEMQHRLFQQKSQRCRSLKLINCAMCDEYRRLPKKEEGAYYVKYIEQLKKDKEKASNAKQTFDTVLRPETPKIVKVNFSSQFGPSLQDIYQQTDAIIEQQKVKEVIIQQKSNELTAEQIAELRKHFENYYDLLEQHKNLKNTIISAEDQCSKEQSIIKAVSETTHVLKLRYQSVTSLEEVKVILQNRQKPIDLITEELKSINLNLSEIKQQVLLRERERQAIAIGVAYNAEFDPELLKQGEKIELRLVDGVLQEVVVDANGAVIRYRIRRASQEEEQLVSKLKSKQENSVDQDWVVNKYGDKMKVIAKDQHSIQYEVNLAQKKHIKVSKDQIEEQWTGSDNTQHRVYHNTSGLVYEEKNSEVMNRYTSSIQEKNEVITEESVNKDGSVTLKILQKEQYGQDVLKIIKKNNKNEIISQTIKQTLKDEDGEIFHQEEEISENHKIVRKTYAQLDEDYQRVTEIISKGGRKSVINIKKFKDKTEMQFVDEYGDEIKVQKMQYLNDQGETVTVEKKFNVRTQETETSKTYKNKDGYTVIESSVQVNGVEVSSSSITHLNANERIERVTKNGLTVEQKITQKGEVELITQVDNNQKLNIHRTSFVKDSVEYNQQIINLPNGAKRQIQVKTYYDANQDKIIEEERVDEFGQKSIIRKRVNLLGEEIVEEFEVPDSNHNEMTEKIRNIERRVPRNDLVVKILLDKNIQTEFAFQESGDPAMIVKTQEQFMEPKRQQQQIIIQNPDFQELDKEVFNRYNAQKNKKDPQFQEAVSVIKKYFNKNENDELKQEEFQEYLVKYRNNHQKCGEQCSHLLRFYAKLGFLIQKSAYNRQAYKLQKVYLHAKEQQ